MSREEWYGEFCWGVSDMIKEDKGNFSPYRYDQPIADSPHAGDLLCYILCPYFDVVKELRGEPVPPRLLGAAFYQALYCNASPFAYILHTLEGDEEVLFDDDDTLVYATHLPDDLVLRLREALEDGGPVGWEDITGDSLWRSRPPPQMEISAGGSGEAFFYSGGLVWPVTCVGEVLLNVGKGLWERVPADVARLFDCVIG